MNKNTTVTDRVEWIHEKTGKKLIATSYESGRVNIDLNDFEKGKSLNQTLNSSERAYTFVNLGNAFSGFVRADMLASEKFGDQCKEFLEKYIKKDK